MVRGFRACVRPGALPAHHRRGRRCGAGDEIELLHRPEHGVTVRLVSDAFLLDASLQPEAAKAPELAASLADELQGRARRA